jgi:hypothetical protein
MSGSVQRGDGNVNYRQIKRAMTKPVEQWQTASDWMNTVPQSHAIPMIGGALD